MLKELNNGKLPEELKLFSGGSDGGNEFKFHAMQNIRMLNRINEFHILFIVRFFLRRFRKKWNENSSRHEKYLLQLSKYERESIYSFMHAQQDETKKLMDFELDISCDFEFYLNEIIAGITDNKFDMNMHSTSIWENKQTK